MLAFEKECNWCGEQEALAQTQEPLIGCVNHDCDKCKAQTQEPVAWITPDGEGFRIRFSPPTNDVPLGWDALYTHPPQRTWVGLTDDEQQQAYEQWQNDGWGGFYSAIEAKLKQKNGYAEEKNT